MSSIKRNIVLSMVMFLLILTSMCLFTACKKEDVENEPIGKVVNLALNPEIELVLDKNNKVVGVNAINDEGNFILAKANFEGLTVEQAVELFLETTNNCGYIVSGDVSVDENRLNISISGDEAENIYNSLKNSVLECAEELNIEINLAGLTKLNKDYLKGLVNECAQELTQNEINSLTEKQLIELIQKSREETKTFFSQELKDLYYRIKAVNVLKTEMEEMIVHITEQIQTNPVLANLQFDIDGNGTADLNMLEIQGLIESKVNEIETQISAYQNNYENIYKTADNEYQTALKTYLQAKQNLLQARVDNESDLTSIKEALNKAYLDFYGDDEGKDSNGQTAILPKVEIEINDVYDQGLKVITTEMNSLISKLTQFVNLSNIQEKVNEAQASFYNSFMLEIGQSESDIQSRKDFWNVLDVEKPTDN